MFVDNITEQLKELDNYCSNRSGSLHTPKVQNQNSVADRTASERVIYIYIYPGSLLIKKTIEGLCPT